MAYIGRLNKVIRRINKMDDQAIYSGALNNRADAKFKALIEILEMSLGNSIEFKSKGFCKGKFSTIGRKYNEDIYIKYELKNMVLGRNYDLVVGTSFSLKNIEHVVDDFQITMEYEGKLRYKDINFVVEYGDNYAVRLASSLKNNLIKERILRLQLIGVDIKYTKETNIIEVIIKSIKGSCTWSLIPPVFQLIKPKQRDCIDLIELIQLIIHSSVTLCR